MAFDINSGQSDLHSSVYDLNSFNHKSETSEEVEEKSDDTIELELSVDNELSESEDTVSSRNIAQTAHDTTAVATKKLQDLGFAPMNLEASNSDKKISSELRERSFSFKGAKNASKAEIQITQATENTLSNNNEAVDFPSLNGRIASIEKELNFTSEQAQNSTNSLTAAYNMSRVFKPFKKEMGGFKKLLDKNKKDIKKLNKDYKIIKEKLEELKKDKESVLKESDKDDKYSTLSLNKDKKNKIKKLENSLKAIEKSLGDNEIKQKELIREQKIYYSQIEIKDKVKQKANRQYKEVINSNKKLSKEQVKNFSALFLALKTVPQKPDSGSNDSHEAVIVAMVDSLLVHPDKLVKRPSEGSGGIVFVGLPGVTDAESKYLFAIKPGGKLFNLKQVNKPGFSGEDGDMREYVCLQGPMAPHSAAIISLSAEDTYTLFATEGIEMQEGMPERKEALKTMLSDRLQNSEPTRAVAVEYIPNQGTLESLSAHKLNTVKDDSWSLCGCETLDELNNIIKNGYPEQGVKFNSNEQVVISETLVQISERLDKFGFEGVRLLQKMKELKIAPDAQKELLQILTEESEKEEKFKNPNLSMEEKKEIYAELSRLVRKMDTLNIAPNMQKEIFELWAKIPAEKIKSFSNISVEEISNPIKEVKRKLTDDDRKRLNKLTDQDKEMFAEIFTDNWIEQQKNIPFQGSSLLGFLTKIGIDLKINWTDPGVQEIWAKVDTVSLFKAVFDPLIHLAIDPNIGNVTINYDAKTETVTIVSIDREDTLSKDQTAQTPNEATAFYKSNDMLKRPLGGLPLADNRFHSALTEEKLKREREYRKQFLEMEPNKMVSKVQQAIDKFDPKNKGNYETLLPAGRLIFFQEGINADKDMSFLIDVKTLEKVDDCFRKVVNHFEEQGFAKGPDFDKRVLDQFRLQYSGIIEELQTK